MNISEEDIENKYSETKYGTSMVLMKRRTIDLKESSPRDKANSRVLE